MADRLGGTAVLRWVVDAGLQSRFLVVAIVAAAIFLGVFRIRDMPVGSLSEFAPPRVEVQTGALGRSAPEAEALITVNLAELFSGVSWLRAICSDFRVGLSSSRITFNTGTEIMTVMPVFFIEGTAGCIFCAASPLACADNTAVDGHCRCDRRGWSGQRLIGVSA